MVASIVGNQTGQVIKVWWWSGAELNDCRFNVRFLANQALTNTHLLNNDDAITVAPLGVVKGMKAFELRRVD